MMQMFTLLQVLLARHKESTKYYAVKVLQKKIILKKKEVRLTCFHGMVLNVNATRQLNLLM